MTLFHYAKLCRATDFYSLQSAEVTLAAIFQYSVIIYFPISIMYTRYLIIIEWNCVSWHKLAYSNALALCRKFNFFLMEAEGLTVEIIKKYCICYIVKELYYASLLLVID